MTATTSLSLTPDQQQAYDAFAQFLLDPNDPVFVLSGYAGCGKSTLVGHILATIDSLFKTAKLINPSFREIDVELTATTNKAAEALQQIAGLPVKTIHSHLNLRVQTDYRTNETKLIPRDTDPLTHQLIFIDEASYIDGQLLDWIFKLTRHCKIVFIGDPAQLTPVKMAGTPVFDAGFPGAALTTVVRQAAGNPIIALATQFREVVNTGRWTKLLVDGFHIQRLSRDDFDQKIIAEFTRPDWRYRDSKVLAWTNKRVIDYNHAITARVKGDPHFTVGDYAVCNSYVQVGKMSVKTDQMVHITGISEDMDRYGVIGNWIRLDYVGEAFMPKSLQAKNDALKRLRAEEHYNAVAEIDGQWVDLRAAYAQTINKSQGSTYDEVFIDLDDLRRCHNGNQIARMLYVGTSRARNHVYFTGDLA